MWLFLIMTLCYVIEAVFALLALLEENPQGDRRGLDKLLNNIQCNDDWENL